MRRRPTKKVDPLSDMAFPGVFVKLYLGPGSTTKEANDKRPKNPRGRIEVVNESSSDLLLAISVDGFECTLESRMELT